MSAAALVPAPEVLPLSLNAARAHHAVGSLRQAAEAYRQALEADPRAQAALLGLSLIARQSGQLQPALRMAYAALEAGLEAGPEAGVEAGIEARRDCALAWANYGDTLAAFHQLREAEAAFRHALALDGKVAAAHLGVGYLLAFREEYAAAIGHFEKAVMLAPGLPEGHFALAFAHGKLGAHAEAVAGYRRAVRLRPAFASAWLNLGVELIADGRAQLAALCYRQAIDSSPVTQPAGLSTQISAHLNLGHLARSRRQLPEARLAYERALALAVQNGDGLHPRLPEVYVALAYLHVEERQFAAARQALRTAASLEEEIAPAQRNPEIPNARGIVLLAELAGGEGGEVEAGAEWESGLEEAIAAFAEAEARGHRTAASNRGNALLRLGRCEQALTAHRAALDPAKGGDPHHPGARYNLALTQLRLGDFERGWKNYEIRWSFREVHPQPRRFSQSRWQGESLSGGAALLLYSEQGLGDTIQFCRYLRLVAGRLAAGPAVEPARIVLEVQPPLKRLLCGLASKIAAPEFALPGIAVEVAACGDPLPRFTHHCPIMSLPALFGSTVETVPAPVPYLWADPALAAERARELASVKRPPGPAIGIAWAGNPRYGADRERSTHLKTMLPLLSMPGFRWISLQKGAAAAQIEEVREILPAGCLLYDGSSEDCDFAATAALVASLDWVITTDTAVAHLAGAMGKPLWLLLPWQSDWRWMQDRLTTPWYPQARLFRQSRPGDWRGVVEGVAAELRTELRVDFSGAARAQRSVA